jgi:four helix bundle protein
MKTRQFRDLLVWQRSMRLAEEIYAATSNFPKEEIFGLASQLRRAAVSVPSNIAEGHGRDTGKSFALFLNQARGSLYEVETQLELARNLRMIQPETATNLLATAAEIGRMLHGLRAAVRHSVAP